jgi:hypothetical protein
MALRGTLSVPPTDLEPTTPQLRSANVCRAPLDLSSGRRDSSEAVRALQCPLTGTTQVKRKLLA